MRNQKFLQQINDLGLWNCSTICMHTVAEQLFLFLSFKPSTINRFETLNKMGGSSLCCFKLVGALGKNYKVVTIASWLIEQSAPQTIVCHSDGCGNRNKVTKTDNLHSPWNKAFSELGKSASCLNLSEVWKLEFIEEDQRSLERFTRWNYKPCFWALWGPSGHFKGPTEHFPGLTGQFWGSIGHFWGACIFMFASSAI